MGKKEVKMVGSMTLKTAVNKTLIQNCVFRLILSNYTLLKAGRLYYYIFKYNNLNCVFKLIKAREKLFVAVLCKYSNAYGKFFLNNGEHIMKVIDAVEISSGLYVGDFPESLIFNMDSDYILTGYFNIAFRFITDISESVQYNPFGEIGLSSDIDELCHDIQSGLIDSRGTDFTLKLDDCNIEVHKCVLGSRSEFFKEYLTKDEQAVDFTVRGIPTGIIYEVLAYMYSGELYDVITECMVKILEVAYLFKIPSLKERCINYFEQTDSWESIKDVNFLEYKIVDS